MTYKILGTSDNVGIINGLKNCVLGIGKWLNSVRASDIDNSKEIKPAKARFTGPKKYPE
jgi:hypothetical protein